MEIIGNKEVARNRANLLINIGVAVAGAILASYFLSPRLHAGPGYGAITFSSMLMSLLGSIFLLVIVHLIANRR